MFTRYFKILKVVIAIYSDVVKSGIDRGAFALSEKPVACGTGVYYGISLHHIERAREF